MKVGVGYLSWTDTDMVRGADEDDVMRELRQRLPWPANRTYPLGPAIDRIVAGIERRSAHVYAQWWLRGMQSVRGYLPAVIGVVGQREMKRFGPRLEGVSKGLVGAGGAADESARGAGARGVRALSVTDRNAWDVLPCKSGRGPYGPPPSTPLGVNSMGIADQFKDKAQELADQAKKNVGDKKGDARQRSSSEASERGRDRSQNTSRNAARGTHDRIDDES